MAGIKDVVEIWPDVMDESLDQQLAPALYEVYLGTAHKIYSDPYEFFKRTYLSEGIRAVLRDVVDALSGYGERNIIPLLSLFGGGKTHTLITILHAMRSPEALEWLDPEIARRIRGLGNVRIVVLDCDSERLVPSPLNPAKVDGATISSIWGMLAYRLDKFDELSGEDRKLVAPTPEKLRRIFGGDRIIILIDEVVKYIHRFANADDEKLRKYARSTLTFIENLAKAVEGTKVVVVITIPIEIRKVGERVIEVAEKTYEDVALGVYRAIKRVAPRYDVPLSVEDVVNVLRKRIFSQIDERKVRSICTNIRVMYSRDEFLSKLDPKDVAEMEKHYPFHPTFIRVLYDIVTRVPELQKTRDALRIARKIVRYIWRSGTNPSFIMPWHIDPNVEGLRADIITPSFDRFNAVVDKDLNDRIKKYASKPELAYKIALCIFLRTYIYEPTIKVEKVFPTRNEIIFMVYDKNVFDSMKWSVSDIVDVLEELETSVCFYLQSSDERYWFTPYPNVIEIIESEAKRVEYYDALEELQKLVANIYSKSIFNLIKKRRKKKAMPSGRLGVLSDKGVGKESILTGFDYVDVDEKKYFLVVCLDVLQDRELEEIIYYRREGVPRQYKNTIVVMFPKSKDSLDVLIELAKRIIAAERISDKTKLKELYPDETAMKIQQKILDNYKSSTIEKIYNNILTALNRIAYPSYDPDTKREICAIADVEYSLTSLVEMAERTLASTRVSKIAKNIGFDYVKFILKERLGVDIEDEKFSRSFGEIESFFYMNPRLPFVVSSELKDAIREGVKRLEIGIIREGKIRFKRIYDDTKRVPATEQGDPPTNITDRDLIVHWKIAVRQLVDSLLKEEGETVLPDGSVKIIKYYIRTPGGELVELSKLVELGAYEDTVREHPIIRKETILTRGIYISIKPDSIRAKPSEKIEVSVSAKPIGSFEGHVRLTVDRGTLIVEEGSLPLDTKWIIDVPSVPGHHEFTIRAESPQLDKAVTAKIIIIVEEEKEIICVDELGREHIGLELIRVECSSFRSFKRIVDILGSRLLLKKAKANLVAGDQRIGMSFNKIDPEIASALVGDALRYLGPLNVTEKEFEGVLVPRDKEVIVDRILAESLTELTDVRFCVRRKAGGS